jgi:hypothetical protein
MQGIARKSGLWLAAGMALLLSGCNQPPWPPVPTLGNAVKHDMAVHIINPDPHWGTAPPPLDGQRAVLIMRHYEGQAVVQPEAVSTTDSSQ